MTLQSLLILTNTSKCITRGLTILEYPRERTNLCQGPVCNEARKALRVYSQLTAEWYNWRRKCRGMDELGHTTIDGQNRHLRVI